MKHLSEFVFCVALPTLVFLISGGVTKCAEPTKKTQLNQSVGLLRLAHGDHVSGTLMNSPEGKPDVLVWQHRQFADPFQFLLQSVDSVTFPEPAERKLAKGEFFIELLDGDRVFGDIVGLDENSLLIRTDEWGVLKFAKAAIQRLARWSSGKAVRFSGPGKLSEWSTVGDQSIWHDQGGELATSIQNASIHRDVGLPDVARIELELSWHGTPDFVLAIGVDQQNLEASTKSAYRIEVWKREIVLLRELEDAADIASLGGIGDFGGNLNLVFDLEQNAGRIQVSSAQGEPLAQLQLRSNDFPDVRSSIQLTNINGSIRLDGLQVMSGRSQFSGDEKQAGTRFVLDEKVTEVPSLVGDWVGMEDGVWIVEQGEQEERVDPQHVLSVEFAGNSASDRESSATEQKEESTRQQVQVSTHAGNSLTGKWDAIADGKLNLICGSLTGAVSVPIESVRRISVLKDEANKPSSVGKPMWLQMADGLLQGELTPTPPGNEPTAMRFLPEGSVDVSATATMAPSFSGRLRRNRPEPVESPAAKRAREARERAEAKQHERVAALRVRRNAARPVGGFFNAITRAFGNNASTRVAQQRCMHLRSGEIISCNVKEIDEQGVLFESDMTSQTRLPHEQVRAVRLVDLTTPPQMDSDAQERLLTVPRIRKNSPPTHLVMGINGDLLRCRLIRMTEKTLQVETRLETLEISRALVSQIIWLDIESPSGETDSQETQPKEDAESAKKEKTLRVRAVFRDKNQMSLIPEQVTATSIVGKHPWLGAAEVRLNGVDELYFGNYVAPSPKKRAYEEWRLRDAPEPIIAGEGDDGGRTPGTASTLVGKQAPDFALEMLEGHGFQVSSQKGVVLVLDFWATWCGPCMQAMPVIEETVLEFDENQVRLVAVNLQESGDAIRKTLKRLGIAPEVALDIDGVAAARYQANAIPQTVVIDREGIVRRVFIGSGKDLGQQLHDVVEELIQKN